MSTPALRKLQQAHHKLRSGDIAQAASICEGVLRSAPRNADALWLLGTSRLLDNRVQDAAVLFERAVSAAANHGPALEQLGLARLMLGQYEAAEAVLRKAAGLGGAPSSVRMRLGLALLHQGKTANAIAELKCACELDPGQIDAHLGLGQAYARTGDWANATLEFEWVLATEPTHADALYNLGTVSNAAGRFSQAALYMQRFLTTDPVNVSALNTLANACFHCGDPEGAFDAATRALELDPASPDAYNLLAQVHQVRGELDCAVTFLEEGFARTGADNLLGGLVHLLHRLCEWPRWRRAWMQMSDKLAHTTDLGSPFWLLQEATSAQQQLEYARRWAADRFEMFASGAERRSPAEVPAHPRARIGYFSADFHQHATAALLAGVLELHDRDRFEIFAYSYGPDDDSAMRARSRQAVEHFIDVARESDDAIIARMRSDRLDVLVDLKGYTLGERLSVLAQRPCNTQVTWLGYPGTTGASFIDYIIADPFVIPAEATSAYSEQVLRLPHCYQPNDRRRWVAQTLQRSEYGLPDDAFVFCCFNQTVKITPTIFACWMRLLQAVPDSVLWLLDDNRWATENLLAAAREYRIADRLVIAPRLPMDRHLARYGVADLALDTHPYTSHTTASDSLWMGCPLVALCGETFAARVSGSILTSAHMADLITYSLEDYEELALRLAMDKEMMRGVRARLSDSRDSAPLFDPDLFVRNLETLYTNAINRGALPGTSAHAKH